MRNYYKDFELNQDSSSKEIIEQLEKRRTAIKNRLISGDLPENVKSDIYKLLLELEDIKELFKSDALKQSYDMKLLFEENKASFLTENKIDSTPQLKPSDLETDEDKKRTEEILLDMKKKKEEKPALSKSKQEFSKSIPVEKKSMKDSFIKGFYYVFGISVLIILYLVSKKSWDINVLQTVDPTEVDTLAFELLHFAKLIIILIIALVIEFFIIFKSKTDEFKAIIVMGIVGLEFITAFNALSKFDSSPFIGALSHLFLYILGITISYYISIIIVLIFASIFKTFGKIVNISKNM